MVIGRIVIITGAETATTEAVIVISGGVMVDRDQTGMETIIIAKTTTMGNVPITRARTPTTETGNAEVQTPEYKSDLSLILQGTLAHHRQVGTGTIRTHGRVKDSLATLHVDGSVGTSIDTTSITD